MILESVGYKSERETLRGNGQRELSKTKKLSVYYGDHTKTYFFAESMMPNPLID
jgi:hypothetical protein